MNNCTIKSSIRERSTFLTVIECEKFRKDVAVIRFDDFGKKSGG